jgi:histidine ammonia-lyase
MTAARAARGRAAVRTETFSLASLRTAYARPVSVSLSRAQMARVRRSAAAVDRIVARGGAVYGVNTGFGLLAQTRIPPDQLSALQRNLVLSHAAGVGAWLPDAVVRLVLVLKIGSLAQGFSGIRPATLLALTRLLETDTYPCIPAKGSVGASGDLAPLAHLAAALLGVGAVRSGGRVLPAAEGLRRIGLEPLELAPKEGLALLNGTQVSTALALAGLFAIQDVFDAALIAGALSVDALKGSDVPFDDRIHVLRGQPGHRRVARALKRLLAASASRTPTPCAASRR